jgi:hypothetical protein
MSVCMCHFVYDNNNIDNRVCVRACNNHKKNSICYSQEEYREYDPEGGNVVQTFFDG